MNHRWSLGLTGILAVAIVALLPSLSWAVHFPLGKSSNDWGLKYDVEIKEAGDQSLDVTFTLADEGRLKPLYSVTLVAFSKPLADGGRSYLAKAPIELKRTPEGKLAGRARIRKEHASIAQFRILTLNVDGRPQTAGAAYYDIPLKKFFSEPLAAELAKLPSSGRSSSGPSAKTKTVQ